MNSESRCPWKEVLGVWQDSQLFPSLCRFHRLQMKYQACQVSSFAITSHVCGCMCGGGGGGGG